MDHLAELDAHWQKEFGEKENDDENNEEQEEDTDLYCIICDKGFKTL